MSRSPSPSTEPRAAPAPPCRANWIFGPGPDLLIALCWVPLWLVGHRLATGHGPHDDSLLRSAVAATFLVSFVHQPLTLGLVYGDANRFAQHRRLFVWTPPVAVMVVVVAVVLRLWVVVPVAALWNTVHTLQQRYGLARIYGRKAGYGAARLDRLVLYATMAAAVLVVAADSRTLGLVHRVSLDGVNAGGIRLLAEARPYALGLLVPVCLVAAGAVATLVAQEWGQFVRTRTSTEVPANPVNPAKWLYQASSLLLIGSIAVDPAAGFIAYVGAHAIEYFVVVYKTAESRYGGQRDGSTYLGRVAYHPAGRLACFAGVVGLALLVQGRLSGDAHDIVFFTVGVLHFFYDGFIWKLRKPSVASDFSIRAVGADQHDH